MTDRFAVTYRVRSDAASIAARAEAIAVEQSVEMPLAAIDEPAVLTDIVGRVEDIADRGDGTFVVRIDMATATVGQDAGQFLNMVFGNTSLHDDVVLEDIAVPASLAALFGGPRHGIPGLRARLGVRGRAFTGSALKPQGLAPERLAELAEWFARGGLDFIKDDHGLADQDYGRFAVRVSACAAAVARAVRDTGHPTRYIPSITGDLDQMRAQLRLTQEAGLDCAMVVPMIAGFASIQAIRRDFPTMALFAHPSLGGAARIAPALLIGSLFRLLGADAVIFPNHGGRFGYAPQTCRHLVRNARRTDDGLRPALPVPAGGMTLARTGEILDFYGPDTMLLIGGNLLMARARIAEEAAAFARSVAQHPYR
ncbi:MAG: RuBisCO large subunit C-terminal-like domain-containing protein [Acetobacteraceae bacterium]|nr:RuBisCO large subunit C-terminal-like domain-containing protein [Acetobacteraceae bacterium]